MRGGAWRAFPGACHEQVTGRGVPGMSVPKTINRSKDLTLKT